MTTVIKALCMLVCLVAIPAFAFFAAAEVPKMSDAGAIATVRPKNSTLTIPPARIAKIKSDAMMTLAMFVAGILWMGFFMWRTYQGFNTDGLLNPLLAVLPAASFFVAIFGALSMF